MPVLDCPVSKEEWAGEIAERNGAFAAAAWKAANAPVDEAGPWKPAVRQLVEFISLGDDWDGLGAKAASRELLASAVGLAYLLNERGVDPPQRVVAGVEGSIILEWQVPGGTYQEIEMVRPLYAEVMLVEPGQPARHWSFPAE